MGYGCDLDIASDRGRTALHSAVWSRHLNLVRMFVAMGCQLDIADRYGDTPAMLAARRGYPDVLQVYRLNSSKPNFQRFLVFKPCLCLSSGTNLLFKSTFLSKLKTHLFHKSHPASSESTSSITSSRSNPSYLANPWPPD